MIAIDRTPFSIDDTSAMADVIIHTPITFAVVAACLYADAPMVCTILLPLDDSQKADLCKPFHANETTFIAKEHMPLYTLELT